MFVASKSIDIRGVVQGVGFRPFVFRLANEWGLAGWVRNTSSGVEIEVQGSPMALDGFLDALREQAPPLARLESIAVTDGPPDGYQTFEIRESHRRAGEYQLVSPDIATCSDCLREVLDPDDRRYRYPFTNCTNCGPRFTIIADIPYDRPNTTMRQFIMCADCQAEYDDPLDRRFHAQPNACPVCGAQVWLTDATGEPLEVARDEVVGRAAVLLREGAVLAIKGLGGFHLACDATNGDAVNRLRERKARPHKPLAVMMASLDELRQHCLVSPAEEQLLTSPACPIVLLRWESAGGCDPEWGAKRDPPTGRGKRGEVDASVAPRNRYLGVMLPYTPLHHVLMHDVGRPLVMTSGNLSEEPIARENGEALRRLGHLADYFLLHNRDIYARYDDSVWFLPELSSQEESERLPTGDDLSRARLPRERRGQPIRRSRGYAPYPVKLPFDTGRILACGAELKNSFCITREEYAFLGQHIGDMENLETLEHFEASVGLFESLFRTRPEIIAYDLHPDYLATRYALERASVERSTMRAMGIQHHFAHLAACLADNGWRHDEGPVIGVTFDGTGYGSDGHVWGGEFLVGDYRGFHRAAHLEYLPMPGGEAAIRAPYRLALGYLYALFGHVPQAFMTDLESRDEITLIQQQIDRGLNTPLTSACGRLFDSVSALLGVCMRTDYEAQAAIELEMLATGYQGASSPYPFETQCEDGKHLIGLRPLFDGLLADIQANTGAAKMARRFHDSIAQMILEVSRLVADDTGIATVALSGGCFQNRLLLRLTVPELRRAGFDVLLHHQVPCNDGGLSLGQAVMAHFTCADR